MSADREDTLHLELQLAEIADRADLLREFLLACERGGELADRDFKTFAPGLAMLADDISRAAMAAYEVAACPPGSSPGAGADRRRAAAKPPRRRPELVSTPPRSAPADDNTDQPARSGSARPTKEGILDRAARELGYGGDAPTEGPKGGAR
jgi:hypothetical protein